MGIDITKDLVMQIKELYAKSAQDKRLYIEDTLLNQQYIRGKQHAYFSQNGEFINGQEDKDEVFNRMLPIYNKRVKMLSRNMPNVKTKPIMNQISIDKKSKITNALIEKVKYDNNFHLKYSSFVKKIETYRLAFYKIIYDYRLGDLKKLDIKRKMNDMESKESFNEEDVKLFVEMIRSGGIDIYVGDGNEFYPEQVSSTKLEDNQYIMHAKAYHIDDIQRAFGVEVKPENIDSITKQNRGQNTSSGNYVKNTYSDDSLKNHAMVIEYYERPTKNNPSGRKVVIAGDKLIDSDTLPYRCGVNGTYDYNFVLGVQTPVEGMIFGESLYGQLRAVQRRYNSNRNLITKFISKKAMGTILSPQDSLDDLNVITNEIGQIIQYNPMYGEPHELKTGDLPPVIWNELNQCELEFSTISGISQSTLTGQMQSNIRSGDQMNILNQNDENSVGVTVNSIIEAHEDLFKKVLRIYKQKAKHLPIEIFENGLDKLLVTPENILEELYVENAGIIGLTEEQQVAKINAAIQLGVLNKEGSNAYGPEHVDLILRESGMAHLIPQLDSDAKMQIEYINRENNKLVFSSKEININDFDDDELHIKYHNRLLMSSEFESQIITSGKGDQIKKAIDEHIQQHRKRLQTAQIRNQLLASQQKK